jgi:hypothetical protein
MKVRSALFRYRRFGTTCWPLENGRKNPKRAHISLNTILSSCESWGKNLESECTVEEDSWARRHEETEELTELHLVLYRLYALCYTVRIITPINVRLTAYVTCNLETLNPCTTLGVKDVIIWGSGLSLGELF